MVASVNASPLNGGIYSSRAFDVAMSTAGATSLEVLTVNHRLGRSPTHVFAVLRCVQSAISSSAGNIQIPGWNGSTATLVLGTELGLVNVRVDVISIFQHSFVS